MKSEVKVNKDNDLEFPFLGISSYSDNIYIVKRLTMDDNYECVVVHSSENDSIIIGTSINCFKEDIHALNGQVILSN